MFPEKHLPREIQDVDIDPPSLNIVYITPVNLQMMNVAKGKILWSLDTQQDPSFEFRNVRYELSYADLEEVRAAGSSGL
jgi:hypothetical protein